MYVRVRGEKYYYQSMAYCIVTGMDCRRKFVVLDSRADRFELVNEWNEDEEWPRVQIIDNDYDEYTGYENAYLLKYKAYCRTHGREADVKRLWGYRDVCENYAFISELIEKKSVPADEARIVLRERKAETEWKQIESQEDADEFMEMFVGFHDSLLKTMNYAERDASSEIRAVFDNSGWYGVVELCFEGVLAVNIRPPKPNCSLEIFDASLLVKDASVFWADQYMEEENPEYKGSWIKALSLKWRRIRNE